MRVFEVTYKIAETTHITTVRANWFRVSMGDTAIFYRGLHRVAWFYVAKKVVEVQ